MSPAPSARDSDRSTTYEISARPTGRTVVRRVGGFALCLASGLGLVAAAVVARLGTTGTEHVVAFGLGGLLLLSVGATGAAQQARVLWPGVLVRVDGTGVHVRRGPGFVSVPWERVAGLRVLPLAAARDASARRGLALTWVPVDDRVVLVGQQHPLEARLPLPPARARLTTLFNGRDRSTEVRGLLEFVRRQRPDIDVVDLVLDSTPPLAAVEGPEIALLASVGTWGLLPQVSRDLRRAGRHPVMLLDRERSDHREWSRTERALGVEVRWVRTDDGPRRLPSLAAAFGAARGLVVLLPEPGTPQVPAGNLSPHEVRGALGERPVVVVVRDHQQLARQQHVWGDDACLVLVEWIAEVPATGRVTLSRERPSGQEAVAAADLAAVVAALVDHPVGGLLHLSAGDVPIAEAVAGCAG